MEVLKKQEVLPDEEIVALFFSREEAAIGETDRKYGPYLMTIALNILKDMQDSEECVNDTYFKTWNAIPPARPGCLRSFLARITRNTAFDRYDRDNRQKRIPPEKQLSLTDFEGYLPDNTDPENELELKEIGRIISAWLDTVNDRKMYIFLSRYFFVIPVPLIAEKLGCSESSVYKELAAMKKQLRQRFEEEGYSV